MSETKSVSTRDGKLYRVYSDGGKHSVSKVSVGLISNTYTNVGRTSSFEDALSLIRSHSGSEIKEIKKW